MFESPNPANAQIIACVRESYGIDLVELEFLPLGLDPFACAFRARAGDGTDYFLKLRSRAVCEAGVAVARALVEAGISQVVAPLRTVVGGRPWGRLDDCAVLLYPFIPGGTAAERGLTDGQWAEYGSILRRVHTAALPDGVMGQVPRETFDSAWCEGVRVLLDTIVRAEYDDPWARELAAIWKDHRIVIARILARADALAAKLRVRSADLVVCHTDPHLFNLLVDLSGGLHLVDWDAPLLAPKERDLHFVIDCVIGPGIGPREEALIFRGYGPTWIDWAALVYYRYEWVCGDLLELGERVLRVTDAGDAAKADAVRWTRAMFEPGRAVASAFALDGRASRVMI